MHRSSEDTRNRALAFLAGLGALALLGLLILRGVLRDPGLNSHGALADAFLHGRLWIENCPEIDCALFQGRTYVIFPPLPALVALPFVALFGFPGFKGFVLLAMALGALSLWAWHRIFRALDVEDADALWLLAAVAFASPLFQVTLRSEGVWFYAQSVGFLMTTLSLWAVICRRSLPLAGLFVALAFLCRQMAIFYPLFLLVLAMPRRRETHDEWHESWRETARDLVRPVLLAGIPVIVALIAYCAYNYARFGSPTETGYAFIHNPGSAGFIWRRITEIGLFSRDYLLFNTLYLFLQGIHFEFGGPYLTQLTGLDRSGSALLVMSPWLLLAVYARLDRAFAAGAVVIAVIAGITLFYHSNGADQTATQRYTLDWLPILLVLMLRGERPRAFAALPLLVTWGILANAAVTLLASLYRL